MFEEIIGIQELNQNKKIYKREAVRAVILKGNKLVMIQTNKGDYKFPGGGINKGENHIECLKREVKEETGYDVLAVGDYLGKITEQRKDLLDDDAYFIMSSRYYMCEIGNNKSLQKLDDYEKEQDFKVKIVELDEIIKNNEEILKGNKIKINQWVYRDTYVLKLLKRYL